MPINVLMPALSPTMTEGNLVKWLKAEGDAVVPGDVIAEIETDKATMEVESVEEGKLAKILVAEGTESVKVNSLIAVLLEEGEDASALENHLQALPKEEAVTQTSTAPAKEEKVASAPAPAAQPAPAPQPVSAPALDTTNAGGPLPETTTDNGMRIFASPVAKRLAEQHNVDLRTVEGTGPHGRIVRADVEKAHANPSVKAYPTGVSYTDVAVSSMRKVIARRLLEAKQNIPHFYLNVKCRLDMLLEVRRQINEGREKTEKLSVNDFAIKALAMAFRDVPEVNVAWQGDTIRQYHHVDVSVAVAIKGGLITPIVTHADSKSLIDLAMEFKGLARRAKDGQLKPEEFQGGTVSLSNLGMFNIDNFQAIVNPPQAAILALGKGEETVVVENGEMGTATLMNATLSVDHRAIDGADAARALNKFKHYMENPVQLLV